VNVVHAATEHENECYHCCSFVPSSSAVDGVTQKVADMEVDDQKIHMDIEEQHRLALEQFLTQKKEMGELKVQDFQKISELGCGNGGVVWKVLHKPSNVTMARKVQNYLQQIFDTHTVE